MAKTVRILPAGTNIQNLKKVNVVDRPTSNKFPVWTQDQTDSRAIPTVQDAGTLAPGLKTICISSYTPGDGTLTPSFPLQDENATAALVDLDFENSRFYFNGTRYATIGAVITAIGAGTDFGNGTYTLGPVSNIPFASYNENAGTIVSEFIKTGTGTSKFVYTIQAGSGTTDYIRLIIDSLSKEVYAVQRASAGQATIQPAANYEQNVRIRMVHTYTSGGFAYWRNGVLVGTDATGDPPTGVANTAAQLGHRGGANVLDGTLYRWAYFPRVVSDGRKRELSYNGAVGSGIWTWFNDPRAIKVGSNILVGGVTPAGSVVVNDMDGGAFTLHNALETDDHDNPALLLMSNGKIMAHYSKHSVDNNHYQRISTNVRDVSAWDAETNLGAVYGRVTYTYSNLAEVDDGIYNFIRCQTTPFDYTCHVTKSTDYGANWTTATRLLTGTRPYFRVSRAAHDRIDIICNDAHPAEAATNSTYHFYLKNGSYYTTDGVPLGNPPFTPSTQLTKIWDSTGESTKSWVWWVHGDPSNPRAVFASFPTKETDHRYHYAYWNGTSWTVNQICTAGGTIYPVTGQQDYYSGGICIDPDNPNIIYCSRDTGSGIFQIWKGITADNGATWTLTQLTSGTEDCYRPFKVRGTSTLVYMVGAYTSYISFSGMRSVALTV